MNQSSTNSQSHHSPALEADGAERRYHTMVSNRVVARGGALYDRLVDLEKASPRCIAVHADERGERARGTVYIADDIAPVLVSTGLLPADALFSSVSAAELPPDVLFLYRRRDT